MIILQHLRCPVVRSHIHSLTFSLSLSLFLFDRARPDTRKHAISYMFVSLFPAVVITSSTVPSSSSTSTAVVGGGFAGLPPFSQPPIVVKDGLGGRIHHHRVGTAAPTLPHVPQVAYPANPHLYHPQSPIHNGPPSSSPPKISIGQNKNKNKNSTSTTLQLLLSSSLTSSSSCYLCPSICLSVCLSCLFDEISFERFLFFAHLRLSDRVLSPIQVD